MVVRLPSLVVQVVQLLKIIFQCNDVPPQLVVVAHQRYRLLEGRLVSRNQRLVGKQ